MFEAAQNIFHYQYENYMMFNMVDPLVQRLQANFQEQMESLFRKVEENLPIVNTPVRYCLKPFSFYYYCRTCSYNDGTGVCEECFHKELHKGHNYIKVKYEGRYCDCGMVDRWDSKSFCKSHGSYSNEILTQKQQKIYHNFLLMIWKTVFSLNQATQSNFIDYLLKRIQQFLMKFNRQSVFYAQITTRVLATKISENISPLEYLVKRNLPDFYNCKWGDLFNSLANCDEFLEKAIGVIFNLATSSKYFGINNKVYSFFSKFQDTLRILNKLADNGILIYNNSPDNGDRIQFYTRIITKATSNRKNVSGLLPKVWKCMLDKKLFNFLSMKKKIADIILSDCVGIKEVFPHIIRMNLKALIKKKEKQTYFFSPFINDIFTNTIKHLKGEEEKIIQFFEETRLPKESIQKICNLYISQTLSPKQYSQINIFVLEGFLRLAKHYQFSLEEMAEKSWKQKSDSLNASNWIQIVNTLMNKFICYPQKKINFLYQCIDRKNKKKVEQYEDLLEKWFRRYLFSRKQVEKLKIAKFKDQGILNFPKAKEIIQKQTTYKDETYSFVYNGPDQEYDTDVLIAKKEPSEIKFLVQDGLFSTKQRMEFFGTYTRGLFAEVNKIDYNKHFGKEFDRKICLRIVILDKILKGSDPEMRKFLINRRNYLQSMKNKDQYLDSLFGIERKEVKNEKTMESCEEKIEQLMTEGQTKIQEKQQKTQQIMQMNQKIEKQPKSAIIPEKSTAQIKKQNKIKSLKEKYAKKSSTHLNKFKEMIIEQEKQEALECIVCKDKSNVRQNPLFYCGSIKNQKFSAIFCKNLKTIGNYYLSSCFHVLHTGCIQEKRGQLRCPLCGHLCNIFLPIIDKFHRNFDDKEVRVILENLKLQLQNNQKKQYKITQIIAFLFRCMINKYGISQLWCNKIERESQNMIYTFNLLRNFCLVLTEEEISVSKSMIDSLIEYGNSHKDKPLIGEIQIMLASLLFHKIFLMEMDPKHQQYISNSIVKIRNQHNLSVIGGLVEQVYKLLGKQIDFEVKVGFKEYDQWQIFLDQINLPETAAGLLEMRKECPKCRLLNCIMCVQCQQVYCKDCDHRPHLQKSHPKQTFLTIYLSDGALRHKQGGIVKKINYIYEDEFKQPFFPQAQNPAQFMLSKRVYLKTIVDFLKN